jgi:hypothetical protein
VGGTWLPGNGLETPARAGVLDACASAYRRAASTNTIVP